MADHPDVAELLEPANRAALLEALGIALSLGDDAAELDGWRRCRDLLERDTYTPTSTPAPPRGVVHRIRLRDYEHARTAIEAERRRQIDVEGYDDDHDRGHAMQLDSAGLAYLQHAVPPRDGAKLRPSWDGSPGVPVLWPWAEGYWKPSVDPCRDLEKAGALFLACLDAAPHTVDLVAPQLRQATWALAERCPAPPDPEEADRA